MSKTFKDKPKQYSNEEAFQRKPKEGKRFVSTKGRKNSKQTLKHNLEDYFI